MFELVYTSASKGLRPGTFAYCTVAMTRHMPAPLAQYLEHRSAYRDWFEFASTHAHKGVAAHSHTIVLAGSKFWRVIARIGPCAQEYSGRTNSIAHHIAMDDARLPDVGPAWLLAQPGVMRTNWSQEPTLFEEQPSLPQGVCQPTICKAWADAAGDAGWAGELLRIWTSTNDEVLYVLTQPGFDPLPLIIEAISLLPAAERWRATFTTCYQGSNPDEVRCQVRFLPATPETRRLVQSARFAAKLDLTSPGPAPQTAFAQCARTGTLVEPRAVPGNTPRQPAPQAAGLAGTKPLSPASKNASTAQDSNAAANAAADSSDDFTSRTLQTDNPARSQSPHAPRPQFSTARAANSKFWTFVSAAAAFAFLLGIGGGILIAALAMRPQSKQHLARDSSGTDQDRSDPTSPSATKASQSPSQPPASTQLTSPNSAQTANSSVAQSSQSPDTTRPDQSAQQPSTLPAKATPPPKRWPIAFAASPSQLPSTGIHQIEMTPGFVNERQYLPRGWEPAEQVLYQVDKSIRVRVEGPDKLGIQLAPNDFEAIPENPALFLRIKEHRNAGWQVFFEGEWSEALVEQMRRSRLRISTGNTTVELRFSPADPVHLEFMRQDDSTWIAVERTIALDVGNIASPWKPKIGTPNCIQKPFYTVEPHQVSGTLSLEWVTLDQDQSRYTLRLSPSTSASHGISARELATFGKQLNKIVADAQSSAKRRKSDEAREQGDFAFYIGLRRDPSMAEVPISTLKRLVEAMDSQTAIAALREHLVTTSQTTSQSVADNRNRPIVTFSAR